MTKPAIGVPILIGYRPGTTMHLSARQRLLPIFNEPYLANNRRYVRSESRLDGRTGAMMRDKNKTPWEATNGLRPATAAPQAARCIATSPGDWLSAR